MAQRFDLVDLQLFLHIAEAASITHGASRSNISLAAASERVRAMEEALGTALLDRKRRGVELTPAGSVLVHHAHAIVNRLELMRGELGGYASGVRGRIRLLMPTGALAHVMPEIVAEFLARHPNVDIEIEERFSRDIVREVAAGHADIGIVIGSTFPEAALENFPLFPQNRLVLAVPYGHALAAAETTTFVDALPHQFVARAANTPLQSTLDHQAEVAGGHMKVRVRLSSFEMIALMVAKGVGIAVVPEFTGRRWERAMPIRVVTIADDWALRPLTGCVKDLKSLSSHAHALVEFLRSHAIEAAAAASASKALKSPPE